MQHVRVGIIQSNYLPWRGYFDFINSVDIFVIYDDVQYSAGSWRNRNRVKTVRGPKWLTVPVKRTFGQCIDEVEVEYGHPWIEQHRGLLRASLAKSPYFAEAMELWERTVAAMDPTISRLNLRSIQAICEYLGITTPILSSRSFALAGSKTERLISLLRQLGATSYLSGPSARSYLDENLFRENEIVLEYKSYDYPPYPQPYGDFVGDVTILDLVANVGPESRALMKSMTPDIVAVAAVKS